MELPRVSVVVTTFLPESKPYLDACMASIDNLNYPKYKLEVILVGKKGYAPEYPGVRTIEPDLERFSNSVGMNIGLRSTDSETKHILYLNDDVILTADSLIALVLGVGDNEWVAGPISNCDNYWKYIFQFPVQHNGQVIHFQDRFYRYAQWEPYLRSMMNTKSIYSMGIINTDYICFYAVLIPRAVLNKVGLFEENFDTGPDDRDFCMRARKLGMGVGIITSSLIWHAGGATSEKTVTPAMREANAKAFKDKWGIDQA